MCKKISPIGYIHTDMPEKFGLPRQSGLVDLEGLVVLEPPFDDPNTLRGIDGYDRLWLIWGFSENEDRGWSPTVRPPKLGGNERVGVFASRSPFRPNGLGLSCVELVEVQEYEGRPAVRVRGVDMVDKTPVYDIKPYLPYAEAFPDADQGFGGRKLDCPMKVVFEGAAAEVLPEEDEKILAQLLAQDPRPGYHRDGRVYGMSFKDYQVRFTAEGDRILVEEIIIDSPCD